MKKIIIGSDKSGFLLKEAVKTHLTEAGYEVSDYGTLNEEEPKPYFEVAAAVAKRVSDGEAEKAILICGTGMGMAIVANKFKNVYAAVCENTYAAEKARAINDANVLTMGGWITGEIVGCAMADVFLNTEFTQNLEEWRANNLRNARIQVKNIENEIYGN
ncbi:RpiB/LacA/LacB family sugar-phosphate isomerase [Anaerobium acetethylicum]|uniref:Ribose 5-phosphate isomerase B n=1 Tax=Anaerobium acetethylicum TaxID=1619234 RepID=A0A1D3TV08_9FIRM|nr:RpiB/LacA/LacB family sugar-phosphate isomerase [Anaerobium acetethylicum]SCP97955.1 ribose 5-phosphate isomerase B [Anaerobium acetethylicum]